VEANGCEEVSGFICPTEVNLSSLVEYNHFVENLLYVNYFDV
jgi:hypothetical protein